MIDEYIYRGTCSFIKFESIEECFKRCINNPYYRVVIYVTTDTRRNTATYIKNHFNQYFEKYRLRFSGYTDLSIHFSNGSMMSVVRADDSSRGYRAHYSLIEDSLSNEDFRMFVFPKIVPYLYDYLDKSFKPEKDVVAQQFLCEQNYDFINDNAFGVEENNELDEFINSFKINKNT